MPRLGHSLLQKLNIGYALSKAVQEISRLRRTLTIAQEKIEESYEGDN